MTERPDDASRVVVRTDRVERCPVCGGSGPVAYSAVDDALFGVPGLWSFRDCARCGSLWLDPAPLIEDLPHAYAEYYTHANAGRAPSMPSLRRLLAASRRAYIATRYGFASEPPRWRARLTALAERVLPGERATADAWALYGVGSPGDRILDVGCGDGSLLALLAQFGFDAEGIDSDPKAVDSARARGLSVRLGDLHEQRFQDASFDVIVLYHVIEHLPDPVGVLAECRRILRPNGRVVITTPNARSAMRRRFGGDWRGLEPPRHLRVYSVQGLGISIEASGLRTEVLRSSLRGVNHNALASRRLRRARGNDRRGRWRHADRLVAECLLLLMAVRIHVRKDEGEEVLAIARRA